MDLCCLFLFITVGVDGDIHIIGNEKNVFISHRKIRIRIALAYNSYNMNLAGHSFD